MNDDDLGILSYSIVLSYICWCRSNRVCAFDLLQEVDMGSVYCKSVIIMIVK